jgi:hypothetical protein
VLFIIKKNKIMKAQLITRICGCILSILLVSSSFAQSDFKTLPPVVVTDAKVKISEKIWTEFYRVFKNAETVKWYEIDKNFLVKFFMDNQEQRALFNKRGGLIYHISYGSEKNLPTEIRRMVKTNYLDYNITMAIKVCENDRTIWVVNLEDAKSLVLVRVEDSEMEEIHNFQKSS